MNYDLVKKLKDAGFSDIRPCQFHNGKNTNECDECASYPTLSELIEKCGDMFGSLTQYDREKGNGWFACGHKVIWDSNEDGFVQCNGDNPEDAVANLWLELNR